MFEERVDEGTFLYPQDYRVTTVLVWVLLVHSSPFSPVIRYIPYPITSTKENAKILDSFNPKTMH